MSRAKENTLIIQSISKAFSGLFDKRSRSVVIKSLGITILLFLGVWFLIDQVFSTIVIPFLDGWTWLITVLIWLTSVGLIIGAGFLLAPVTAIFAGLFLDEVAEQVERDQYSNDPIGRPMPIVAGTILASKFALLVLAANFIALLLVWFAGFGVIIFFLLNGYLLGREYFQFAAMRFQSEDAVKTLRKKYSFEVFICGLAIAGFMSIPILNLLTPVFAAKTMVHLHKSLAAKSLQPE